MVAWLVFCCSIIFPLWWNLGSSKTNLDKIAAFVVAGSLCIRPNVVVVFTVPMPWCVGTDLFLGGHISESSAQQNTSTFYSKNLLKLIRSCQHEVWLESWGNASSEVLAVRCGFDPVQPSVSSEKFTLWIALSPTNFLFFLQNLVIFWECQECRMFSNSGSIGPSVLEINLQREKNRKGYAAFTFDFFFFWPSKGSCRIQLQFHWPQIILIVLCLCFGTTNRLGKAILKMVGRK